MTETFGIGGDGRKREGGMEGMKGEWREGGNGESDRAMDGGWMAWDGLGKSGHARETASKRGRSA